MVFELLQGGMAPSFGCELDGTSALHDYAVLLFLFVWVLDLIFVAIGASPR